MGKIGGAIGSAALGGLAGGVGGLVSGAVGGLGSIMGIGRRKERKAREAEEREHQRQLEYMGLQAKYNKEQAQYSTELSKEMWDYTNFENQVKHLKAAGLNPALLYGNGGGGGGSASGGGNAAGVGLPTSTGVGMGIQWEQMEAQKELAKAEAAKTNAEAAKLMTTDTENYGKWLSIQQTFAHAATIQGQAALMQGRAAITNANANASYLKQLGGYYGALTSGQRMSNDMQRYYTDFMLGKMPIGKAESILRQTPYKHLLDLNIQQNEWSLNKLMQEPDLIRSLSGMYKSETSLTNKRVDSYDTDKIFERGESATRMFKNVLDCISNFTPKPKFSKGSSTGGESTPPPSGKSWLICYRENPNYSPSGYR